MPQQLKINATLLIAMDGDMRRDLLMQVDMQGLNILTRNVLGIAEEAEALYDKHSFPALARCLEDCCNELEGRKAGLATRGHATKH